jgi:hypothetical protein
MFRPTFERLENREVFATLLGLAPAAQLAPAMDPLPVEISSLKLAAPEASPAASRGGQFARVSAGDVNSDNADLLAAQVLPYIEQENIYKQITAVRGDGAFVSQLAQDLLGRTNDSSHDAVFNQLSLTSDSRLGDLNRPQGIIAILIG